MKKILFSFLFILTFSTYVYYKSTIDAVIVSYINKRTVDNQVAYRDGSYTGNSANAYYGNIQVQVDILNGKIQDITFLQYPKVAQNSVWLNEGAMPKLKTETIVAQSAMVDGVTGASLTSAAYIESLSSALTQAKL